MYYLFCSIEIGLLLLLLYVVAFVVVIIIAFNIFAAVFVIFLAFVVCVDDVIRFSVYARETYKHKFYMKTHTNAIYTERFKFTVKVAIITHALTLHCRTYTVLYTFFFIKVSTTITMYTVYVLRKI